ncbi:MAG TPA: hypothetical protein VFQ24_01075 [Terriglobia bacterium]|nr:hypothetical protein [Terriglobia bacterium]
MGFRLSSTAKYVFPVLFAVVAVVVFAAPANNKKIWPNAVDFSGGKISGSFVITTTGGAGSLLSSGTGGACLVSKIEEMFRTGKAPYPVERTLMVSGILDSCLTSKLEGQKHLETPYLNVRYQAPVKSQRAHE